MTETHSIIIGGSSGIGLAAARSLTAAGHRVTVAGRDLDRLKAAEAAALGVTARQLDACDPVATRAFFAAAGAFDHLVLALGSSSGMGPFASLEPAAVKRQFEEKVFPQLFVAQAALPHLAETGSITFISAVSSRAHMPGTAGLAAANAAIEAVVPVLAVELAPRRVNCVAPGVVDTAWWDFLSADQKGAAFVDFAGKTPVKRVGRPDDIAAAIGFLIADSFMTGHCLVCDGGLLLAG
ncbi:MAG: SDR family oxidoreductase [Ancalomicrobiaceae bacterium]|nr:SDR family oxidoreductase [Ancalomicrobiaceae bacterium]